MKKHDITKAILCGTLFEEKLINRYYKLYDGELSKLQAQALEYLSTHPEASSKELTTFLQIAKQHTFKIVQKLISCNLISSKVSTRDKRVQLLSLTEQGVNYLEQHVQDSNQIFFEKLSSLTDEEQVQLFDSFETLCDLLEKI